MKHFLGYSLVALPFILILTLAVYTQGWVEVILAGIIIGALCLCIWFGVKWIMEE